MFFDFHSGKQAALDPSVPPTAAAMRRAETVLLFLFGALGYGLLEVLWRGYTHWSMLLCGGTALLELRRISRTALPFWGQCFAGMFCISGLELIVGLLLNRWLQLGIWDYSALWGNLWGQVCPAFSLVWLGLSAVMLTALRTLPEWNGTATAEPIDPGSD